jgi:hypothetical protein
MWHVAGYVVGHSIGHMGRRLLATTRRLDKKTASPAPTPARPRSPAHPTEAKDGTRLGDAAMQHAAARSPWSWFSGKAFGFGGGIQRPNGLFFYVPGRGGYLGV